VQASCACGDSGERVPLTANRWGCVHKQARKLGVSYSFLFMQSNGAQLGAVIDKTFPFDQTLEALAYVEQGRANGKVVITLD
jgi:NADPH:quinone reductase-like Zn-dependent oxidoreductase